MSELKRELLEFEKLFTKFYRKMKVKVKTPEEYRIFGELLIKFNNIQKLTDLMFVEKIPEIPEKEERMFG